MEPVEPVALEPLHFLNPRNFWILWNQLNAWGSTGSKHSLGSTTLWFHRIPDRFFGLKHAMVPQVPDRFLGFNRGTVGIVEGVNFGNCPNYVVLNGPLCRTILKWAGIRFWQECLSRIETTPLVPQVPDRFLGFNHAMGSTGWTQGTCREQATPLVSQVPDRFLGLTVELWELWRVRITKQWFCLMYR